MLNESEVMTVLATRQDKIINFIGKDSFYKELSFAIQAVNSNTALSKCNAIDVAKCVYNLAITGLSLNPVMKLAYLVPMKGEVVVFPSYQGLVKLINDTGSVSVIQAKIVYEGDEFEEIEGSTPQIIHKPKRLTKKIKMAYACCTLPNGEKMQEVMDLEELEGIRARSEGYRAFKEGKIKSTPWVSDMTEMCRKTVLKRLVKYIPKTDRWIKVQEAINLDDMEYPATEGQRGYIEALLMTSSYDEDLRDIIRQKISDELSSNEAENIIKELRDNQLNPIKNGFNYNQSDIKTELDLNE